MRGVEPMSGAAPSGSLATRRTGSARCVVRRLSISSTSAASWLVTARFCGSQSSRRTAGSRDGVEDRDAPRIAGRNLERPRASRQPASTRGSPTRQSRMAISRALGTIRWTLSRRRARKASAPVRLSVDASAAHIDARPRRRSRRRRPARTTGGGAQLSPVMRVPGARIGTDRSAVPDFKGDATLPPPRFVRYSSRFRCRRPRASGLPGSSYPWTVEGRERLRNPIPIGRRHRRSPFRCPIESDCRAVSHRTRAIEPRDEAPDDQRAKRGVASAVGDRELAASAPDESGTSLPPAHPCWRGSRRTTSPPGRSRARGGRMPFRNATRRAARRSTSIDRPLPVRGAAVQEPRAARSSEHHDRVGLAAARGCRACRSWTRRRGCTEQTAGADANRIAAGGRAVDRVDIRRRSRTRFPDACR